MVLVMPQMQDFVTVAEHGGRVVTGVKLAVNV
jgi:hypothetical protein